jgi:hypothetical protein
MLDCGSRRATVDNRQSTIDNRQSAIGSRQSITALDSRFSIVENTTLLVQSDQFFLSNEPAIRKVTITKHEGVAVNESVLFTHYKHNQSTLE